MRDHKNSLLLIAFGLLLLVSSCSETLTYRTHTVADPVEEPPDVGPLIRDASELYDEALRLMAREKSDEALELFEQVSTMLQDAGSNKSSEQRTIRSLKRRCLYHIASLQGLPPPQPERVLDTAAEPEEVEWLTVVHNSRVDFWLDYFQKDGRKLFEKWLSRAGRYRHRIEPILEKNGLPTEMIVVAMVESGINTRAVSRASAVGLWQFTSGTGRLYGLRVDWWVDERRDVEKSTEAAAHYLLDLEESLGSWPLALAAYNCGEGRIAQAIRKAGSLDFWKLRVPRETANHVPKIMAALEIWRDPERFGFDIEPDRAEEFEVLAVDECTDLHIIADASRVKLEDVLDLNPALLRWCTPPDYSRYPLKVHRESKEACQTALASIPPEERVKFLRHKVGHGETLSRIADGYGTSMSAIAKLNNLRNVNRIRAGSYLTIPLRAGDTSSYVYSGASRNSSDENSTLLHEDDRRVYVVRNGDSLWRIARRFKIPLADLKAMNSLGNAELIIPGQKLFLDGPARSRQEFLYVVRPGDTLWDIGRAYGLEVSLIRSINGIEPGAHIHPGQSLRLQGSGLADSSGRRMITHIVRRGETVWQIAQKYESRPEEIDGFVAALERLLASPARGPIS